MEQSWEFDRDGIRLFAYDFGGQEPSVVFLHGLAGYAGEWSQTATWLTERNRVVAFDARGHGASERNPSDVSRVAHVDDVIFLIERMTKRRVVLVGQSLGGITALLVASKRPDLVRGLVLIEAAPSDGTAPDLTDLESSLKQWPVPFRTREAAVEYFAGHSTAAWAWAGGLEERHDGLWPRFDIALMVETLRQALSQSNWPEWRSIQCPTLIIRGENGDLPLTEVEAMLEELSVARMTEIAGAKHDLHLDHPDEWRRVLIDFLDSLESKR